MLTQRNCPKCHSDNYKPDTRYIVDRSEKRQIYCCQDCGNHFSETKNTPAERLRTPLSFIAEVLDALNEGMSINAACRHYHISKNSIRRWLRRFFGDLKEILLLYALCHQFLL